MKISIITVCLNAQNTIEKTLVSIFNQTSQDFELIIIDGKSTDKTLEIIQKYKQKLAYFISEEDAGIYDAMNKGIKIANGDFLMFLNADDLLHDEFVLEKVIKTLNDNPEIKILFGNIDFIDENEQTSYTYTHDNIKNDFSLMFNPVCHQAIFYHQSLFQKYGPYSLDYKICADGEFNIKCFAKEKSPSLYLNLTLAKFRSGGFSSLSSSATLGNKEKKIILKKYYPISLFLININGFLRKHCLFLYKIFNNSFAKIILDKFTSQKKYKLNIKKLNV